MSAQGTVGPSDHLLLDSLGTVSESRIYPEVRSGHQVWSLAPVIWALREAEAGSGDQGQLLPGGGGLSLTASSSPWSSLSPAQPRDWVPLTLGLLACHQADHNHQEQVSAALRTRWRRLTVPTAL